MKVHSKINQSHPLYAEILHFFGFPAFGNLDAIHDTVREMARDEARHGKAFKGLLDRYFG